MLTEKQLNRINKLLSTRTFKFKGQIINDLPESMTSDIDYKFKIDGVKINDELNKILLSILFFDKFSFADRGIVFLQLNAISCSSRFSKLNLDNGITWSICHIFP